MKNLIRKTKGLALNQILPVVIIFAVAGLILTFTSMVNEEVQDSITDTTSYAYNTTVETGEALFTFAEWLPILAIVIVAGIIIWLLVRSFNSNRM